MRTTWLAIAAVATASAVSSPAAAQITARGRAFSSMAIQGGSEVGGLTQADTGPQSATEGTPPSTTSPCPSPPAPPAAAFCFDGTQPPPAASPLADILANASKTNGTADGTASIVSTDAGGVLAQVPGASSGLAGAILSVATTGAHAEVDCPHRLIPNVSGTSGISFLSVGGMPQPVSNEANNTQTIGGLMTFTTNRQVITTDPATGKKSITVTAFDGTVTQGDLRILLSRAVAELDNLPTDRCDFDTPVDLTSSIKSAVLKTDADGNRQIDPGDTVHYTITAVNNGTRTGTNLVFIDRLPNDISLVAGTATLDGAPVTAAPGACPSGVRFDRCSDEASTQCLVVSDGSLLVSTEDPPENARVLEFDATINPGAVDAEGRGTTCNTVIVQTDETAVERANTLALGVGSDAPPLPGGSDRIRSTGSGGCSLGTGAPAAGSEIFPVLGVLLVLAVRRGRGRAPRAE